MEPQKKKKKKKKKKKNRKKEEKGPEEDPLWAGDKQPPPSLAPFSTGLEQKQGGWQVQKISFLRSKQLFLGKSWRSILLLNARTYGNGGDWGNWISARQPWLCGLLFLLAAGVCPPHNYFICQVGNVRIRDA